MIWFTYSLEGNFCARPKRESKEKYRLCATVVLCLGNLVRREEICLLSVEMMIEFNNNTAINTKTDLIDMKEKTKREDRKRVKPYSFQRCQKQNFANGIMRSYGQFP